MRIVERNTTWVIYLKTIHGKKLAVNAVCEQGEWEQLEAGRPGYHTLVRGGFTNECEAERAARGTSGDLFRSRRSPTELILQHAAAPQG